MLVLPLSFSACGCGGNESHLEQAMRKSEATVGSEAEPLRPEPLSESKRTKTTSGTRNLWIFFPTESFISKAF